MRDIYSLHAQTQHGGFKIVSRSNFLLLVTQEEALSDLLEPNRLPSCKRNSSSRGEDLELCGVLFRYTVPASICASGEHCLFCCQYLMYDILSSANCLI